MINAFERCRIDLSRFILEQSSHITTDYGWSYNAVATAPNTYEELLRAYTQASTKVLPVFDGASTLTIYDCPNTNHAFRFVHDMHHISLRADFSYEGELTVGMRHVNDVATKFGWGSPQCLLMRIDTIGQLEYYHQTDGKFVEDQLSFARAKFNAYLS